MTQQSVPLSIPRRSRTFAIAVVLSLFASTFSILAASHSATAQTEDFGTATLAPTTSLAYVRANLHPESDQWALTDELIQRSGLPEAAGEDISLGMIAEEAPEFDGEVAFVLTDITTGENIDFDEVSNAATDPMSVTSDIPSGFAVIYQPENIDVILEEIESSVETATPAVETSEYGGVTIQYAPPADEFSDGYAFAQVNDEFLVIATIPEDLEPIIDTANGDIDPLSDNEDFTAIQDKLTTDSMAFGYFDSTATLDQVIAASPDTTEQAEQIPEDVLAQAQAKIGFTFYAADDGFRFDSVISPDTDGALPALTSYDPTLDERVSADSLLFASGSDLGPSGALDAVALIFVQAFLGLEPGATPVPDQDAEAYADELFAQSEAQLGFNIKTDFIDQLVGEFGTSVSVTNVESGIPSIDAVFVSGAGNPTTVDDVLSKISFIAASAAPEDALTSRDLSDGTSVYQVNVGDESFPMVVEFGVVGDQLVIGLNGGMDQYVDGPAEPLSEDENYQAVFANLPEEVTSQSFINVPKIVPIVEIFATSMSSSMSDNNPACGEFDSQEDAQAEYDESFDFDLDQDFDGEACEDYFSPATPAASPAMAADVLNILGIGAVTYDADGDVGQSVLVAIGE